MPVTVLMCEGVADSPDARVLNKLLGGYCSVLPAGSKYGLDNAVLIRRGVTPASVVMGLRDADFDGDWTAPSDRPSPWEKRLPGGGTERVGWIWARKEIENYLIDPEVVARALGAKSPPADRYREALERAARDISEYTAARVALSRCRLTIKQLPNRWGRPRGGDRHLFPDNLTKSACRRQLKRIVVRQTQGALPEPNQVVAEFKAMRPHHAEGGDRRGRFLYTFAGKDLLFRMEGDLKQLGFANCGAFREGILTGIRDTLDDIADWLPEWATLRTEIQNHTP